MPVLHPYLSVIIPAFNEAANFRRGTLDQVHKYLSAQKYPWEIILVNDGSTDETASLLQDFANSHTRVRLINNLHQGKAATVITGALAATGRIVLFSDMDQATPISELPKLLGPLAKGFDIAIGSRSGRKGAPLFRQVLAWGNVILRTAILQLPFTDTQCGFKAFSRDSARKIFTLMLKIHPPAPITGPAVDPGFDIELLYLGRKFGYRIREVPVLWHYQESRRVRFIYDAISGLKGLLLVRLRSLTGAYRI